MNVKHRACMNRRLYIIAAMLCASLAASGQSYQRVIKRNFWNEGTNVVGIRQDTLSASNAEIYGNYITGELRASSDAKSAWTAGVRASAIRHLKKFSMKGSFGFEQMEGQGMAGSMFVKQGYYPINVYEFTPGSKTLQTYSFTGGISVDISPEWRLGGQMLFESSNYAKRKDLRHTTYRMDMTVSPGVQYHNGDLAIGLNYIFSKNSESVSAEQIGSSVASYDVFFDKGLYYGVRQIWTGSGVHLSEPGVNGLPLREIINGVSVQASYGRAYADVSWRARYGTVGEKQFIWFRFPGWDLTAHAGFAFSGDRGSHRILATAEYFSQDNEETSLEKVSSGGVTTVEEFGACRIFSRRNMKASLTYDYASRMLNFSALLSMTDQQGLVSNMYPYLMYQRLLQPYVEAKATGHFGRLDVTLMLSYRQGWMNDTMREVSPSTGVTSEPERLESYFLKYREHMTCRNITVAPAVKYNFGKGFYAEASVRWNRGFNLVYFAGPDRTSATLRLGYDF